MSLITEERESEILNSASKLSNKSDKTAQKCDHKCVHQGDRICYNEEKIAKETVKKIPEDEPSAPSPLSVDADSLHSGESMFKTFSFDTEDQNPDMEKCLSFWQTILEKNVRPIKCSLVKPKKSKQKESKIGNAKTSEAEKTKKMWLEIYKDLQRRNLDKIKLVKNKTCDPCSDYVDEEEVKKQDKKDIKELNDWKSENHPSRVKIDVKSQIERTLQVLHAARTPSQTKAEEKEKSTKSKPKTKSSPRKEEKNSAEPIINEQKSIIEPAEPPVSLEKKSVPSIPANSSVGVKTQDDASSLPGLEELALKLTEEIFCCKCGCDCDECICEEMDGLMRREKDQEEDRDSCYPCDCSSECVCGHRPSAKSKICSCDCGVQSCECEAFRTCACGCGLEGCCCKDVEELEEKRCECGCGTDECICETLFTKSCTCGAEDCDCGTIEILNAYLDGLGCALGGDGQKLVSAEVQTEEHVRLETTQNAGSYCIICGHYNCYCTKKLKAQ